MDPLLLTSCLIKFSELKKKDTYVARTAMHSRQLMQLKDREKKRKKKRTKQQFPRGGLNSRPSHFSILHISTTR